MYTNFKQLIYFLYNGDNTQGVGYSPWTDLGFRAFFVIATTPEQ